MKTKILLALILGLNIPAAFAQESMGVAASGWAGWMRGDVVVDGQTAKVQRDSDNYFDDLDYAYALELTLRNSSMVVLGSFDYYDSISSEVTVNGASGSLDSSENIYCLALGYPMGSGSTTFDFLVGLQVLDMENKLNVGGTISKDDATMYDAVAMVRYQQELFSGFYLNIPLSIGGGYLSDSQFVYDAGLQLMYQFGSSFDVRVGYRISGYDFSEDTPASDFYQQGYTATLGITF